MAICTPKNFFDGITFEVDNDKSEKNPPEQHHQNSRNIFQMQITPLQQVCTTGVSKEAKSSIEFKFGSLMC